MPFDIYSTRAQLAAIELFPPEYSFLYDTFVHNNGAIEEEKAIYDFRKGSRLMAPVVHEGVGGVMLDRPGFETREIGFCTIAPERPITNTDLQKRAFGENVIGGMTPAQREKKMLVNDLLEMRKAIQRRREWMTRQLLLTGKLDIFKYTNEGRDIESTLLADYHFTQHYVPDTMWSDSSATIDADMKYMTDMVYEAGGIVDRIAMAPDVAEAMVDNSNYVRRFEGLHIDMGKLNSRYIGQGVRFVGWNSDGVEMYSVSGKFLDDSGKLQDILPSGTIIVGGRGMINGYHGPVTQVEEPGVHAQHKTYIKEEVPLRYGDITGNSIANRLTSRPTLVPKNVDGWVHGKVL